MPRQTLLIDADDTLWENNVFFEQTIEQYISLLEPLGHPREHIRGVLNETERRNIRQHGYGVRSFGRSLEETYLRLAGHEARRETLARVEEIVRVLESTPPKILDGVPDTLAYLAGRHRLLLVTKGETVEQTSKLERSGLQNFFSAVEIVGEKDASTYQRIVRQHRVRPARGWMVGNSPRSDINPALAAGLNAVFIPHPHTWELEHAELVPVRDRNGGRLMVLSCFRDLRNHF